MKSGKDNWEKACLLLLSNITQGYRNGIILLIIEIKITSMYFFKGSVKKLVKRIVEPKKAEIVTKKDYKDNSKA